MNGQIQDDWVVRSSSDALRQNIQEGALADFLSGIEQDVDRMDQTPPKDPLFTSGPMFFETVVIEQTLIDPFGSRTSPHA